MGFPQTWQNSSCDDAPCQHTADKRMIRHQHGGMRIVCPHCQATYQIDTLIRNAMLVCHRCKNEFDLKDPSSTAYPEPSEDMPRDTALPLFEARQQTSPPENQPSPYEDAPDKITEQVRSETTSHKIEDEEVIIPLHELEENVDIQHDSVAPNIEDEFPMAPSHKNTVIWPWLVLILLSIGGTGIWQNQEVWLNHHWTRSALLNLYIPIDLRHSDWKINRSKLESQWIEREDGSKALLITGRIENLLYASLQPPTIHIKLFEYPSDTSPVWQESRQLSKPPTMEQLKHIPFQPLEEDRILIKARAQRGFIFLIESTPAHSAHFTLEVVDKK
ncbi:MAG: hypothetical protein R8K22_09425 [Mariprofundaceae bacterium]